MHPAYSVIVFTTLSGAGYGLLIWLCLYGGLGLIDAGAGFGIVAFVMALAMISVGLLTSTLHLGHPERVWRAFSQWRSSWLSREGVAAIATYVPAGVFAIGWIFLEARAGVWLVVALLSVVAATTTVYCTGMIYASLRTIRQWHHALVPVVYIVLALATGALLFNFLFLEFGRGMPSVVWLALLFLVAGFVVKNRYWQSIDAVRPAYTPGTAIGFPNASVRPLDPPHSQPNYVMREMGFSVARKHATRLRRLANLLCFFVPMGCMVLTLMLNDLVGLALALLAVLSAVAGVLVERWLFFAEARHVVTVYYGAERA